MLCGLPKITEVQNRGSVSPYRSSASNLKRPQSVTLSLYPVLVILVTQPSCHQKPSDTSRVCKEDGVAEGGYCWGAHFPGTWMETPPTVSRSQLALGPIPYQVTADRQTSALGRAL